MSADCVVLVAFLIVDFHFSNDLILVGLVEVVVLSYPLYPSTYAIFLENTCDII